VQTLVAVTGSELVCRLDQFSAVQGNFSVDVVCCVGDCCDGRHLRRCVNTLPPCCRRCGLWTTPAKGVHMCDHHRMEAGSATMVRTS
jgi:hypothetical protein